MNKTWKATVLTLFPEMFPGPLRHSIAGKAFMQNKWSLDCVDMREFAADKHRTVDDTPYGGGVGMVLKPDVVHDSLCYAQKLYAPDTRVSYVYVTPRGQPLTQNHVKQFSQNDGIVIVCGRYEGIDQRVIDHWHETKGLMEISMGDYVLSGGEMAALTILDACIRLRPDVLIKKEATQCESFELDLLEFSQYTKPCIWQNTVVPEILLSGDHSKIAAWRQKNAEEITKERRPDLWETYVKNKNSANQYV
jgi:tRNA (guanine37-N1)-methyltransferase